MSTETFPQSPAPPAVRAVGDTMCVGALSEPDSGLTIFVTALGDDSAALTIDGALDLATAEVVTAVIDDQLSIGRRFLRLDLSRLAFCDCAGLRAIVSAHEETRRSSGALELTGVQPRLRWLLAVTRLDEELLADAT